MLPQSLVARIAAGACFALVVCWVYFSHPFHETYTPGTSSWTNSGGLLHEITNRTLGFQKIFVIGLPERTDRRDRIILQAFLSGVDIEFIDGVLGAEISDKAIPKAKGWKKPSDGAMGCWRAHMNIMDRIVAENITTALILEDDADWDVRIRQQLLSIAIGAQALIQPIAGTTDTYADPSYHYPREKIKGKIPDGITELDFFNLPKTEPATYSPYGDKWSILWLGHVKIQMPSANDNQPRGRVIIKDDPTVAPKKYLTSNVSPFRFKAEYPEFTRVIHHSQVTRGTAGYAVTHMGAMEILNQVGTLDMNHAVDISMGDFCDGEKGRGYHTCIATQPPIFLPYRAVGPKTDTTDIDGNWAKEGGWFEKPESLMNRISVQINAERLIRGEEPVDQYEADGSPPAL
ncbi:glycosyltransferase family 25 protein [Ilyonectria robusta]